MARKRAETVSQFVRRAVARAELYERHLGADLVEKLVHHAKRMEHHRRRYDEELNRIQQAANEVGLDLSSLGRIE